MCVCCLIQVKRGMIYNHGERKGKEGCHRMKGSETVRERNLVFVSISFFPSYFSLPLEWSYFKILLLYNRLLSKKGEKEEGEGALLLGILEKEKKKRGGWREKILLLSLKFRVWTSKGSFFKERSQRMAVVPLIPFHFLEVFSLLSLLNPLFWDRRMRVRVKNRRIGDGAIARMRRKARKRLISCSHRIKTIKQ